MELNLKSTLRCLIVAVALSGSMAKSADIVKAAQTAQDAKNPISAAKVVAAAALVASVYKYLTTFPYDGPNQYSDPRVKAETLQACKEIMTGKNVKSNMVIVVKYAYLLWSEGLCGHASRVGSPRFNEKTGKHEIPFVESRGAFGWIADQADYVVRALEIPAKVGATVMGVKASSEMWRIMHDKGVDHNILAGFGEKAKPAAKAK